MTFSVEKDNIPPRLIENGDLCSTIVSALLSLDVSYADGFGPPDRSQLTPFHAKETPGLSVKTYVFQLVKYFFASNAALPLAFCYMRRVARVDPRLFPSSHSVHRLLLTSMVIATKYLDDIVYDLSYYASTGGLSSSEVQYLETVFLTLLNFRVYVSPEDFHQIEQGLIDELENAPSTLLIEEARKALIQSGVRRSDQNVCYITMHENDPPVGWNKLSPAHQPLNYESWIGCCGNRASRNHMAEIANAYRWIARYLRKRQCK